MRERSGGEGEHQRAREESGSRGGVWGRKRKDGIWVCRGLAGQTGRTGGEWAEERRRGKEGLGATSGAQEGGRGGRRPGSDDRTRNGRGASQAAGDGGWQATGGKGCSDPARLAWRGRCLLASAAPPGSEPPANQRTPSCPDSRAAGLCQLIFGRPADVLPHVFQTFPSIHCLRTRPPRPRPTAHNARRLPSTSISFSPFLAIVLSPG